MSIFERDGPQQSIHAERIRVEQVAALYGYILVGVLGAFFAAIVLAVCLYYIGSVTLPKAGFFIAAACICTLLHLALRHFYWRSTSRDENWRFWARWFGAVCFADGVMWGWATVFLVEPGHETEQYLVILAAFSVASGSLPALGSYLPALYAIFFPITLPFLFVSPAHGEATYRVTALLDVVYIGAMLGLARQTNENFIESLRLRFEKDALAEKLRLEKERAEEANLAKSRFLASASHDLRQPIHALGMFLGALSQHEMSDEMRRLVGHMEGSVNAMDSLFSSLLDISRLDAGVVQSHPQSFRIDSLMERICRDNRGEAQEKNIRLVYCPSSLTVFTDPILLERILRNIISNAVRYTDKGRVLVGCRRRGRRLRIEIWDQGRGIPQNQQDRVFEEFYQLGNPERDRTKGLGLGLAIVKRLTVILDCPFELRSRLGKGTIFTLSVPITNAASLAEQPVDLSPGVLRRGLILVVDDEITIREAMNSLLSGWGHQVILAGSGPEMLEQLADCPKRPDLIICDYRLRGGENGIDVIRRLQSEYNEDIPAVLITGDTAPDRLSEAKASGFLLLHKPVANVKLRATISHLMSAPQEEAPHDSD
jgi:two-component system, sensor histidine kinase